MDKKEKPLWEGCDEIGTQRHPAYLRSDEPIEYADVGRSYFLQVAKTLIRHPRHKSDGNRLVYGLSEMIDVGSFWMGL